VYTTSEQPVGYMNLGLWLGSGGSHWMPIGRNRFFFFSFFFFSSCNIVLHIIIKYVYILEYCNRRPASCGVPYSSHTTAQSIPRVAAPFLFRSTTAAVLTSINRRSTPFRRCRRHRLVFIFIRLGVLEGLYRVWNVKSLCVRSIGRVCITTVIIICA